MENLPDPLTPADSDLRGMPYLPVDIVRLFDSDFYALSTGEEFKAGFTLWGKAFLQKPAGSLPDDDRILEHLAGTKKWRAVRDMALRGWIKCSDGRLYHRTLAEKVLEAWSARLARREQTEAARAARHRSVTKSETENETFSATEDVTSSKGSKVKGSEEKSPIVGPPTPLARPADSGAGAPQKTKKGSRIPENWWPTPTDRGFASELGLDAAKAAAAFKDHFAAQPGSRGVRADWSAAWRSWCRRAAELNASGNGRSSMTLY